jgi:hypothetical protein
VVIYNVKKSEENLIANRQFTCWYNINSLKHIMGEIYVNSLNFAWKGTILHSLHANKSCKTYNFRIKVGNVQMVYFQEVVSCIFLLWVIPIWRTICALLCKLILILFFQSFYNTIICLYISNLILKSNCFSENHHQQILVLRHNIIYTFKKKWRNWASFKNKNLPF